MRCDEHPWRHSLSTVNGIRLHVVEAGAGPPVVLLHGFPEFWYSWRHQLHALAGAGFHAIAPDLRGYNESERPEGIAHYRLNVLVADVAALIETMAGGRATIVGHDWGGVVAWQLALTRPELLNRLVILNAPHTVALNRELRNPVQWLRSSYMAFFQLPRLPERFLAAGRYAGLLRTLRNDPVRPHAFSALDLRRYQESWLRPGGLTAPLNYYRALRQSIRELRQAPPKLHVPTLLIWGEQDPYLGVQMTQALDRWVPRIRVARLPDASHWVQNDAPERVNQLLIGFLHGC